MLETLILSRAQVPFPPLIEALFLELVIDLLREAGARLPMKVGQTLGIVGGIVIGQASVQAGLTSNILLIIVALSALASFITPIYKWVTLFDYYAFLSYVCRNRRIVRDFSDLSSYLLIYSGLLPYVSVRFVLSDKTTIR